MHEKDIGTLNEENGIQVDHQCQINGPYNVNKVPDNTAQNLVLVLVSLNSIDRAYNPQLRTDEADENLLMGIFYEKVNGKWAAQLRCKGDTYAASVITRRDNVEAHNDICVERLLMEVVHFSRVRD